MFVEYDCLHFRSMYLMLIEYTKNRIKNTCWYLFKIRAFSKQNHDVSFFFLSGFSFTDTAHSQDSRGREGTIFYSTLSLPLAHEHSDIYLQLCTWDDYHIFLIAPLVFTRLLPDEIYHLIELLFWVIDDTMLIFVCLLVDLIQGFCYCYLTLETRGLELAWTIILVLPANRLTKCARYLLSPTLKVEEYKKLYGTAKLQNFTKSKNICNIGTL